MPHVTRKYKDKEQWRPIPGYEGIYEVSSHGRVKRIKAGKGARPGYILAQDVRYDQCHMLNLMAGTTATRKLFYVHRLVALAFIGPIPPGYTINHLDGDRSHNHVSNLEICTEAENKKHAGETGLIPRGENHHCAKLNDAAVRFIRKNPKGLSYVALGKQFGVSPRAIAAAARRKNWKHVT